MARKRSPHPGIVVLKAYAKSYRKPSIRYRDPDTGRPKTEQIPEGLSKEETLRWLKKKSAWLKSKELQSIPPPAQGGLSPAKAVDKYFDQLRARPATIDSYTRSTNALLAWPDLPVSTADLDLPKLTALRDWLNRPSLASETINFHLRQLSPVIRYWRRAGLTPKLTSDDISDGLQLFRRSSDKELPLSVDEIRALIQAITNPGFRTFVVFVLLTGMRTSEALKTEVEFFREDEIELPGRVTKNGRPRRVDLKVSPAVKGILKDRLSGSGRLFPWRGKTANRWAQKVPVDFDWDFQKLRVTCSSFIVCAPSIYGAASLYMEAARLGHTVRVAEDYYVTPIGVNREARTIEEAMGIADLLASLYPI